MESGFSHRVRVATLADIPQILEFWAVSAENEGRPSDDAQDVARLFERDPDALILAEADGAVVGSLICGWDGWRFHLYRLAVHPDWRRRGIARSLLDVGERRCNDLGANRLDALVHAGNQLGASFWKSAGYREQDEWRRWVKSPSFGR